MLWQKLCRIEICQFAELVVLYVVWCEESVNEGVSGL